MVTVNAMSSLEVDTFLLCNTQLYTNMINSIEFLFKNNNKHAQQLYPYVQTGLSLFNMLDMHSILHLLQDIFTRNFYQIVS